MFVVCSKVVYVKLLKFLSVIKPYPDVLYTLMSMKDPLGFKVHICGLEIYFTDH